MKKLLSVLASFGLVTTAGSAVVACHHPKENLKVDLRSKLLNLNINNLPCADSKAVLLGRILDLNQNSGVKINDLQVTDFHPATYFNDGWALIEAQTQSQFQGAVVVKLDAWEQTDINEFLYGQLILGHFNDANAAFKLAQKVIDENPHLKGKVTLSEPNQGKIHVKANDDSLTGDADFTYELKSNLAEMLKDNLDLGYVDEPNLAVGLARKVLCDFKIENKVDLKINTEKNQIHVSVKPEFETELEGQVDFTYQLTMDLADLLKNQLDLKFVNNEIEANKQAVAVLTQAKIVDKVELSKPNQGKIHVKANHESLRGEVDFIYQLTGDLKDLLKNQLDLGFVDNLEQASKAAVAVLTQAKIADKVELSKPNQGKIHVKANDDSLKGEVDFTYQLTTDIAELLKNKLNLKFVHSANEAANRVRDIINGIPELTVSKVIIETPVKDKIHVKANHESLRGEVDFTYQVSKKIDEILSEVNKDLGVVESDDQAEAKVEIILKEAEILDQVDYMTYKNKKQIIVLPKNDSLQGSAVFIYQVQESADKHHLSEIVTQTNLNEIDDNDPKVIIEEIEKLNPESEGKIAIKPDWTTLESAVVVGQKGSGYIGEINVAFSTKEDSRRSINDLIADKPNGPDVWWRDLGHFASFDGFAPVLAKKIQEIPQIRDEERHEVVNIKHTGAGTTGSAEVISPYFQDNLYFFWAYGKWND